jgi:hypothetical protein
MNRARRRVSARQVLFSWLSVGEVLYLASQTSARRYRAVFFGVVYLGDPATDVALSFDIGLANSTSPNNVKLPKPLASSRCCAGAAYRDNTRS